MSSDSSFIQKSLVYYHCTHDRACVVMFILTLCSISIEIQMSAYFNVNISD